MVDNKCPVDCCYIGNECFREAKCPIPYIENADVTCSDDEDGVYCNVECINTHVISGRV